MCRRGRQSRPRRFSLPHPAHRANQSMVTPFTMHLPRTIPNAGNYLEFTIEGLDYFPWQDQLFSEWPYDICDGQVTA